MVTHELRHSLTLTRHIFHQIGGPLPVLGGNLVSWKSKKQTVVGRSIAEADTRARPHTSCKLMWMRHLLEELCYEVKLPMSMYFDNQAAIHIASNPVFDERTKYIEVDYHFIRERVQKGIMAKPFVSTGAQLVDMFTKSLFKSKLESLCNKLGLCGVLELECECGCSE